MFLMKSICHLYFCIFLLFVQNFIILYNTSSCPMRRAIGSLVVNKNWKYKERPAFEHRCWTLFRSTSDVRFVTAKPVGRSRACPASLRVRKGKVKHCMPDERSSRKATLGTASRMQILLANEMPKHRKHYGCAAIMRFLNAIESLETQKILRMRSDNANFECQRKPRNTENITEPQR